MIVKNKFSISKSGKGQILINFNKRGISDNVLRISFKVSLEFFSLYNFNNFKSVGSNFKRLIV